MRITRPRICTSRFRVTETTAQSAEGRSYLARNSDQNDDVARRFVFAAAAIAVLAVIALAVSPARVIVANVDGPLVSVEVVGFTHVSVGCPDTRTIWVPLLRVVSRDVVVTDARTGSVLRETTVSGDTVVLIRGTTSVLTGPPGSSYGPAPTKGCL
jgi:hypothetical protein